MLYPRKCTKNITANRINWKKCLHFSFFTYKTRSGQNLSHIIFTNCGKTFKRVGYSEIFPSIAFFFFFFMYSRSRKHCRSMLGRLIPLNRLYMSRYYKNVNQWRLHRVLTLVFKPMCTRKLHLLLMEWVHYTKRQVN